MLLEADPSPERRAAALFLIYYLRELSPAAKISEVVQRSEVRGQKSGRFLRGLGE